MYIQLGIGQSPAMSESQTLDPENRLPRFQVAPAAAPPRWFLEYLAHSLQPFAGRILRRFAPTMPVIIKHLTVNGTVPTIQRRPPPVRGRVS